MDDRKYTLREMMEIANPDFAEHMETVPMLYGENFDALREIIEKVNQMDPYCIIPLICTLFDEFCEKTEVRNREAVFNIIYFTVIEMNEQAGPMYPETQGEEENGSGEDQEP